MKHTFLSLTFVLCAIFLIAFIVPAKADDVTGGTTQMSGFDVRDTLLGNMIYAGSFIENIVNMYMTETDTVYHKYDIALTYPGEAGSFMIRGVRFSYVNSQASTVAFKTTAYYLQPFGKQRRIVIPAVPGQDVYISIYDTDDYIGLQVQGMATDYVNLYHGDNYLRATSDSIVIISSDSAGNGIKPKFNAILYPSSSQQLPIPTTKHMTCAEAASAALQMEIGATGADTVIVIGYVTNTNGVLSRGQQTFWLDDLPGTEKTLQGYWCNMPAGDTIPLVVGDKVQLTGHLTNYKGTTPEISGGDVMVLERTTVDTIFTTVCDAINIVLQSGSTSSTISEDLYSVVDVVDSAGTVNTSYSNQNFFLRCPTTGELLQAYRATFADGVFASAGDTVMVTGMLQNYNGTAEFYSPKCKVLGHAVIDTTVVDTTTGATPTPEVLAKFYNTTNNIVFCVYFEQPVCNELVIAGSYMVDETDSWITDVEQLVHMEPLRGYNGWYVGVVPFTENSYVVNPIPGIVAKPIQLSENGFDWQFQTGDINSWEYVAGQQCDISYNGYQGESEIHFFSPGAYIYVSHYFKNHNNACAGRVAHTYSVTLSAPDCGGFEPAIIGSFTGWGEAIAMQHNDDGTYFYTWEDYEGNEFKFRASSSVAWENEILLFDPDWQMWYANPNILLGEVTDLFVDYSAGRYTFCYENIIVIGSDTLVSASDSVGVVNLTDDGSMVYYTADNTLVLDSAETTTTISIGIDNFTMQVDNNSTVTVTDDAGIVYDGGTLTIATGDTAMFVVRALKPLVGNGSNGLVIEGNIVISSVSSTASSSPRHRTPGRKHVKADVPPVTRHPAISGFGWVEKAEGIEVCAVYYTGEDGSQYAGDPGKAVYHAAEAAYGEVDVDTQSFVPATSIVFADESFYTDYIDGKIDITDALPAVPATDDSTIHTVKILQNGVVYVLCNGVAYTILGIRVR